ncbi:hypothetical protein [Photobacterium nomapromontoriensis]|uniref:hypothetical protein n=1 Tax=Photobacterium nomapromontoriensis TaxID=2910237 RepID=UPI003D1108A8
MALKKQRLVVSLCAMLISQYAYSETIFYCETENGKKVEIQDLGEIIHYRYGKQLYHPELALTIPRALASTYQWMGAGRSEYYSVSVPNKSTVYSVYTSRERRPDGVLESGIYVESNGQSIATIRCKNDTLYEQLMGVDLKQD